MPAIAPRLAGIMVLGIAFIAMTLAVTGGLFTSLDTEVAQAMHDVWQPSLHGLFQGIAELGGFEVTTLVMIGLTVYLWRSGFGSDALVIFVFIAAQGFELFYKLNLHHPQPPRSLAQSDGPSVTMLFESGSGIANSFPSGHMLRAVIAFGLLAFVVRRLSTSPVVGALAVAGAIAVTVLLAFDRLYLEVHWESDVIGGLLLGAIALLAGTVWLDRPKRIPRPRKPEN